MKSYEQFGLIYEEFMRDAPYERWVEWLLERFPQLPSMRIADIGCGTGTLTRMLASHSPNLLGVDPSESMLGIAYQRALEERKRIRWLCQDARSLHLPHRMDLVVSTCDTLNYLVTEEDFRSALGNFWSALNPGGAVALDVIGEGRLQELRNGFSYDIREDAAVLFETRVEPEDKILYDLHAFVETEQGLYERFEEIHEQQYYSSGDATQWLEEIGFEVVYVEGDFGETELSRANRVIISARKPID